MTDKKTAYDRRRADMARARRDVAAAERRLAEANANILKAEHMADHWQAVLAGARRELAHLENAEPIW